MISEEKLRRKELKSITRLQVNVYILPIEYIFIHMFFVILQLALARYPLFLWAFKIPYHFFYKKKKNWERKGLKYHTFFKYIFGDLS